jgi:glycosyltransferase involved in cell wall biosynthesis
MEEIGTSLACSLKSFGVDVVVFTWTYLTSGSSQYERRLREHNIELVAPNTFFGRIATDWDYRINVANAIIGLVVYFLWPLAGWLAIQRHLTFVVALDRLKHGLRHRLLNATQGFTPDVYINWQLTLKNILRPANLVNQLGTGSAESIRWALGHNLPVVYSEGNTPSREGPLQAWEAILSYLPGLQHLTALSQGSKDALVDVFGLSADSIAVIPGPVQFLNSNSSLAVPVERNVQTELRLLYVGRLDIWKGLTTLIYATQLLNQHQVEFQVTIVGNGSERSKLELLVRELELQKQISFVGSLEHEHLPQYYMATDIFVAPSLHLEGLGLVVPEAMSFSLPIVASNIPAFQKLVQSGDNGILVPPGDAPSLASALEKLQADPTLRRQMGQRSRQRFEEGGFDPPSFAKRYLAIYRQAITG